MPKLIIKKSIKEKTKKAIGNKEIPINQTKVTVIRFKREKLFKRFKNKIAPIPKQPIITMAKIDFLINNALS